MQQRNHYAATAAGSATPDSQGPDSKTPGGSGQALQGSGNQVHRDSAIDSRTTVVLRQRVHERVLQAMAPITATSSEKRDALLAIRDAHAGNAGAAQEQRLLAALEKFPVSSLDILGAILELLAGGLPVDIVTVFNVLQERGQDDGAGGLVYINDLAGCVPSAANIGRYADVVLKAAMRRAIADAADKAVKIASTTVDPTDALDAIESVFGGLRSTKRDLAPRRFSELLLERTAHWTSLEDGTATAGIPTRLEKLNTVLGGGIKPGKNVVLAGRPGSGKSSLAWSIACDVAAQGSTVLVLSMEMQAGDLMDRAAASLGRVSLGRITTGRFEKPRRGV